MLEIDFNGSESSQSIPTPGGLADENIAGQIADADAALNRASLGLYPTPVTVAPTLFQLAGRLLPNSLFSVFLKTKVPNGICLRPRLSKNLSQALRTDKICPGRRSLNFSTSRLEFEPRDPTGLSFPNLAPKRYFVFIGMDLYIKAGSQSWYLF